MLIMNFIVIVIFFIDSKFESSKGTGWVRNKIQNFYDNEDYTLWLDSHMRFSKDWDDKCINQIKKLKEQIDTTYYYQPEYSLFEFTLTNKEYQVADEDQHTNHMGMLTYAKELQGWINVHKII